MAAQRVAVSSPVPVARGIAGLVFLGASALAVLMGHIEEEVQAGTPTEVILEDDPAQTRIFTKVMVDECQSAVQALAVQLGPALVSRDYPKLITLLNQLQESLSATQTFGVSCSEVANSIASIQNTVNQT